MTEVFGIKKPKVDPALQRSQRRQEKQIQDQTAEEAKEAGARRRLIAAKKKSGGTLYKSTGGAGVKDTFG